MRGEQQAVLYLSMSTQLSLNILGGFFGHSALKILAIARLLLRFLPPTMNVGIKDWSGQKNSL